MRQKKVETVVTCRLAKKKWGVERAEPAADGERRRGRKEKKVAGQVRDDVVTEGGRRAAEISYGFFLRGKPLLFVLGGNPATKLRFSPQRTACFDFQKSAIKRACRQLTEHLFKDEIISQRWEITDREEAIEEKLKKEKNFGE